MIRQLTLLACFTAFPANALFAQAKPSMPPRGAEAPAMTGESETLPPHQIGVIDVAYVFKNYQKFNTMTASLQGEIEQMDDQAKTLVDRIKHLQGQLSSGSLTEGSPEFVEVETGLLNAKNEFETFKRVAQRDFVRKEADIYKTIYLEVEDAVRRYAKYYHYTLVIRFDRQPVSEADNPRDVMNGMNRQVLYFRAQDDLTEPILEFLNSEWQKQSGGTQARPGQRPAAGTVPSGITR